MSIERAETAKRREKMNHIEIICKIPHEIALREDFLNKLIKKTEKQVKDTGNNPHMIIEITWGQQNSAMHIDARNQGANKEQKKITYLCDGRRCRNSRESCYVNGGECHHTKDIKHAKYFREWSNTYEEVLPDVTGQHLL